MSRVGMWVSIRTAKITNAHYRVVINQQADSSN